VIADPGQLQYQLYGPDRIRLGAPAKSFAEALAYVPLALGKSRATRNKSDRVREALKDLGEGSCV